MRNEVGGSSGNVDRVMRPATLQVPLRDDPLSKSTSPRTSPSPGMNPNQGVDKGNVGDFEEVSLDDGERDRRMDARVRERGMQDVNGQMTSVDSAMGGDRSGRADDEHTDNNGASALMRRAAGTGTVLVHHQSQPHPHQQPPAQDDPSPGTTPYPHHVQHLDPDKLPVPNQNQEQDEHQTQTRASAHHQNISVQSPIRHGQQRRS